MIAVDGLTVRFPAFSLEDIDLSVAAGECFALIGPTGSGKTLLLESLAGLVPVHRGRITIDGRDVTALPPENRNISIVYQDCALFPHLSVRENIGFGLRYRPPSQPAGVFDVDGIVAMLGLGRLLTRGVGHLSGGERQRVALARALAVAPTVLLLDEPLSALDPNFREDVRDALRQIHQQTGVTILMVTHDFAEARSMAGKAAVIHQGKMLQTGAIDSVFSRPRTPFVARFIGMQNLFEARFTGRAAHVDGFQLALSNAPATDRGHVAFYPEAVTLTPNPAAGGGRGLIVGSVQHAWPRGDGTDVRVKVGDVIIKALVPAGRPAAGRVPPSTPVAVHVDPADIAVIPDEIAS